MFQESNRGIHSTNKQYQRTWNKDSHFLTANSFSLSLAIHFSGCFFEGSAPLVANRAFFQREDDHYYLVFPPTGETVWLFLATHMSTIQTYNRVKPKKKTS
jgi:hypothetical protein